MDNARSAVATCMLLAVLIFAAAACGSDETRVARGAELLDPLKKDLKQALVAGMQQGPLNAISACKIKAPEIAASLSVDGIKMGRTSHRLRNPANVAPVWVKPLLQRYLDEPLDNAPAIVSLPDNREGYVEPIVLQPLCLACHGKTLAPDVAAYIEQAYPDDRATGFEVGDLRGVYWAEYSTGK